MKHSLSGETLFCPLESAAIVVRCPVRGPFCNAGIISPVLILIYNIQMTHTITKLAFHTQAT